MKLKLSQFDFKLPPELLVKQPLLNRDDSRMMVIHKDTGLIEHKKFVDILDYFEEEDVMIFNKMIGTQSEPARSRGRRRPRRPRSRSRASPVRANFAAAAAFFQIAKLKNLARRRCSFLLYNIEMKLH